MKPENEWILDVLTDIETYAKKNGIQTLAAKVAETRKIAQDEIGTHKLKNSQSAEFTENVFIVSAGKRS